MGAIAQNEHVMGTGELCEYWSSILINAILKKIILEMGLQKPSKTKAPMEMGFPRPSKTKAPMDYQPLEADFEYFWALLPK